MRVYMNESQCQAIERATGRRVTGTAPLSGGCVGTVLRVDLADGSRLVAKLAGPEGGLECEGHTLRSLAARSALSVPGVIHAAPDLLLIDHVESDGRPDAAAEEHAAVP